MSWNVVKFLSEDTIEAIPSTWYVETGMECFWPPTMNVGKINKLIKTRSLPEDDWKPFKVAVLGRYESLEVASRKAQKALETSELDSINDSLGRNGPRPRNRLKPRRFNSSESDSGPDSSDSNSYPRYPKTLGGAKGRTREASLSNKENRASSCDRPNSMSSTHKENPTSTCDRPLSEPSSHKENSVSFINNSNLASSVTVQKSITCNCKCHDAGFRTKLWEEFLILNNKLDDLLLSRVVTAQPVDVLPNREVIEEQKKIIGLLPIKNNEDMAKLEDSLIAHRQFMVKELSLLGGNSVKEVVRKCMYRTFSNEFGQLYTWEGTKKKGALKKFLVAQVIVDAIRCTHPTATEAEIIYFIKLWLVRAKDRLMPKRPDGEETRGPQETQEG